MQKIKIIFAKYLNSIYYKRKVINKHFKVNMQNMNNQQKLFELAVLAQNNAYAPYSNFKVGVAILSDDHNFYTGCNVENIAYPSGSCAEAGAISAMIAGGGHKIKEILILADGQDLISPCGNCRQKILEFANDDTVVHLATPQGIQKTIFFSELMPLAFSETGLKK